MFLLLAAVASDIFPELSERLSILEVERIAVVALIIILFNGGTLVGWRRFRVAVVPILSLGVFGTFATAGIIAVVAHYVLGFEWITAGLLGAAIAPTDPAVMFSVLGNKEIRGRAATILEGESGVNDPVGIALMVGMIELATHDDASVLDRRRGVPARDERRTDRRPALRRGMRPLLRISLPDAGLYPIADACRSRRDLRDRLGRCTAPASSPSSSPESALGDADVPFRDSIERFHTSLASLAEVVVFVALGLTIDVTNLVTSTGYSTDWRSRSPWRSSPGRWRSASAPAGPHAAEREDFHVWAGFTRRRPDPACSLRHPRGSR